MEDEYWSSRNFFWNNLIVTLDKLDIKYDVLENIALKDRLDPIFKNIDRHIYCDLPKNFVSDYLSDFYRASFSRNEYHGQEILYQELLKYCDFSSYDLIICSSPDPFFYRFHPATLVLSNEVGIFSRPPFPFTQYFDPEGFFSNSLSGKISKLSASIVFDCFKGWPDQLGVTISENVKARFNFQKYHIDGKGKKKILFPGFNPSGIHMRYETRFKGELECLTNLHQSTSNTHHIFYTARPNSAFSSEIANYINRYPNDITLIDISSLPHEQSTFILGEIDAVYTVNSTLGYQAALFGKDLYVPKESSLKFIATHLIDEEENSVTPFPSLHLSSRGSILSWLLSNYFLTPDHLSDEFFLLSFLEGLINYRKKDFTEYFSHNNSHTGLAICERVYLEVFDYKNF